MEVEKMDDENKLSPFVARLVRATAPCILWFGRRLLKWNRLEKIDLIDLDTPIDEVVSIYGDPIKSEPVEEFPEAILHSFCAGPFHEAVVVEWNRKVCAITYWSAHADPDRDLECMLVKYGRGIGWDEQDPGYLCIRKDGKVRLWCSAVPAIGVATTEYFAAKNQRKAVDTPTT
jgi:hypothetical protein